MSILRTPSAMSMPLRVLIIEDEPDDAELMLAALRQADFGPDATHVADEPSFRAQLGPDVDVILADYALPQFDAPHALQILKERELDVPLIVVSGTIGEDTAVACMRDGAADYLLKDRLARLGPAVRHALAARRDREGHRWALAALRASEERYALAARGARDGLWDWDLRTDALYLSDHGRELLGCGVATPGDAPSAWLGCVHPDDLPGLQAHIAAHLAGDLERLDIEVRMLHNDGEERWLLVRGVAIRDAHDRPYRMAGSLTDITAQKRTEAALIHDALHDSLTGLPNRALFMDRLGLALRRAHREEHTMLGVLVIGLDRFKLVTDSLGDAAGDELLRCLVQRLERCIRASDTLARVGVDWLAILLDHVTQEVDAATVCRRIRRELEGPFMIYGQAVFPTVSIGIATSVGSTRNAEDLLRAANTAMHRAKELGPDHDVVFDPSMHRQSLALLRLEGDLRQSIARNELALHYQPIVGAADGAPVALEALIRWHHPERGLIPPGQFIAVAEERGLIVQIGEWVLAQAIRDIHAWDAAGMPPVRLSVNLSARQLGQESLVARIGEILHRHGLPPIRLELELTESLLMENTGATIDMLKGLRAMGVQIAIDDFGTGYSSLAYLHELPVSSLKIDRSFVQRISTRMTAPSIVRMIVNIAHDLGLRAVAEGVETPEQRRVLSSLGCDELQGYLFSKPLPIHELMRELPRWLTPAALRARSLMPAVGGG